MNVSFAGSYLIKTKKYTDSIKYKHKLETFHEDGMAYHVGYTNDILYLTDKEKKEFNNIERCLSGYSLEPIVRSFAEDARVIDFSA